MVLHRKAVVLGAGFAGLWLSRRLLEEGFDVEIIEQNAQPGGLMETVSRDGFLLDLGPHILLPTHLDHYRELLGEDLLATPGFYGFGYRGKQILSPLSPGNLLRTLGPQRGIPFAASMAWHKLPFSHPRPPWKNVDGLLTAKFGQQINEALFRHYIPKVTGLPSTEVSKDWFLERYRFYQEHSLGKQILKKAQQSLKSNWLRRSRDSSEGLDLYYPSNGAQMLTDTLSSELLHNGVSIKLESEVTGIDAHKGRVTSVTYSTKDGKDCRTEGDLFASTLPVTHLPHLFDGALGSEAEAAAQALSWRHLWLFFVAVDRERVSDKIQIYFTEGKYPFKRVYEPKNLIPSMGRPNMTALCIEVCHSDTDRTDLPDEASMFRAVCEGICEFYGLSEHEIHFMFSRKVPYSYAIYRLGYEEHLGRIAASLLPMDNFVSYGRQGSFRYNHLVDRIIDASDSVMAYVTDQQKGKTSFLGNPDPKSDFY